MNEPALWIYVPLEGWPRMLVDAVNEGEEQRLRDDVARRVTGVVALVEGALRDWAVDGV